MNIVIMGTVNEQIDLFMMRCNGLIYHQSIMPKRYLIVSDMSIKEKNIDDIKLVELFLYSLTHSFLKFCREIISQMERILTNLNFFLSKNIYYYYSLSITLILIINTMFNRHKNVTLTIRYSNVKIQPIVISC